MRAHTNCCDWSRDAENFHSVTSFRLLYQYVTQGAAEDSEAVTSTKSFCATQTDA